jgi:molybdate transport system substrate-binding protein
LSSASVTVRIVMRTLARILAILIALLAATAAARAAEINAFVSTAIKTVTDELLPLFERANGHTIRASYAPSGALLPRFERGEPVDVFLTDSAAIDALIRQGKIVAGRTDLARTGIGVAVRKGAPRPDVSSAEALRRALIAAKTVGYAAPAGGSITAAHVMGVLERLGIAAEVAPKARLAAGGPNGRVSVLVSSGQAEIGFQQVSELMSNPDVEVIGMLPAELQQITIYSAGVTTSAREAEAARALIRALTAPTAGPVYKAKGLDPAW